MMAATPEDIGMLILVVFAGTSVLVLVRAWARKIENQSKLPKVPAENAERMERMERAIDSVAIEIERISENQRFLTKLLSERADAGALPRPGSSRENSP
jgi:hypothetical protein